MCPGDYTGVRRVIRRVGARVLVLDAEGRVLLLRGCDPATPEQRYWITVGGGVDEGEDARAAAARELFEETGLRLAPDQVLGPVHHDVAEFPFAGQWYRQEQDWFWVRAPDPAQWTMDTSGFEPIEQAYIDDWRWWSADELRATDEVWYPAELADLVARVGNPEQDPSVDSTCE